MTALHPSSCAGSSRCAASRATGLTTTAQPSRGGKSCVRGGNCWVKRREFLCQGVVVLEKGVVALEKGVVALKKGVKRKMWLC